MGRNWSPESCARGSFREHANAKREQGYAGRFGRAANVKTAQLDQQ
jgi:hypothetical protein